LSPLAVVPVSQQKFTPMPAFEKAQCLKRSCFFLTGAMPLITPAVGRGLIFGVIGIQTFELSDSAGLITNIGPLATCQS